MPTNFYMYFVTALIPLAVGAFYYNDKVLGKAWMETNGFSSEDLEGANMAVIFGVSFLMSVLLSFTMAGVSIHQTGVAQVLFGAMGEGNQDVINDFNAFMGKYGDVHRTFGHGALHGAFYTIFAVLPVIAINSLFERRGWKYILIHTGYWLITLTIMAGVLCKTLEWAPIG